MAVVVKLKDLDFGCASAEVEFSTKPALLIEGYLDERGVADKLLTAGRFLILGNKGYGKSSIAKHLELRSQSDPNLFITNLLISDLSYRTLKAAVQDDIEDRIRYPRAWAWLILITLLASARKDAGLTHPDMAAFEKAVKVLAENGLLPTNGISSSLTKLSELGIQGFGFGFTGKGNKSDGTISISSINENIKELLRESRTESRHILIIDGLDDVLLDSESQFEAISALIYECSKLNEYFLANNDRFKVVVLCRHDVYSRLPGPNLNKIRQDLSISLDWYIDSNEVRDSPLIHLANKKAGVAYPGLSDIFDSYFPPNIRNKDIRRWLLEYTRFRPRDFLQLLTFIKDNCEEHEIFRGSFREAIRKYSQDYFIPELKNDLFGFQSRVVVDQMFRLLQYMHAREFSFNALTAKHREFDKKKVIENVERMCELLYEAGAIGNGFYTAPRLRDGKQFPRVTYKYRSRESSFNQNDLIIVHPALVAGLRLN